MHDSLIAQSYIVLVWMMRFFFCFLFVSYVTCGTASGKELSPCAIADIYTAAAACTTLPVSNAVDLFGVRKLAVHEREQLALTIVGCGKETQTSSEFIHQRKALLQRLNMFSVQQKHGEPGSSLFSRVGKGSLNTVFGAATLAHMVSNPTDNQQILEQRQRYVNLFLDEKIRTICNENIACVKKNEDKILSCYKQLTQQERVLFTSYFWSGEKFNLHEVSLGLRARGSLIMALGMPLILYPFARLAENLDLSSTMFPTMHVLKGDNIYKRVCNLKDNWWPLWLDSFAHINPYVWYKVVQGIERTRLAVTQWEWLEAQGIEAYQKMMHGTEEININPFVKNLDKETSRGCVINLLEGKDKHNISMRKDAVRVQYVNALRSGQRLLHEILEASIRFVFAVRTIMQQYQFNRHVQEELIGCASVVKAVDALLLQTQSNPMLKTLVVEWEKNCKQRSAQFEQLLSLLRTNTFAGKPSVLSRMGRVIQARYLLEREKESFADLIRLIGIVDAYSSIAQVYRTYQNKRNRYHFVKYYTPPLQGTSAVCVQAPGLWNPFVGADGAVANDFYFGNTGGTDNAQSARVWVVTGANSGGKSSTTINGFGTAVLLAQTIGMAPTSSPMKLSPFHDIKLIAKVQEDAARGKSHSQVELEEMQGTLRAIKQAKNNNHRVLVLADELFEGMTSDNTAYGLYRLGSVMVASPGVVGIMVTQCQTGITDLERDTQGVARNVSVDVVVAGDSRSDRNFE